MIRKYLLITVAVVVSLFLGAQVRAEVISDFQTRVQIVADGSIEVQETINYDFGNEQRHGIYRLIDLKSAGISPNLLIDEISVTDDEGRSQPFRVSTSARQLEIKIGDANRTITGAHVYKIRYRVQGALGSFQDHDELYWNITGNSWPVSMTKVRAEILLPQALDGSTIQTACFAGVAGSTVSCDFHDVPSAELAISAVRFEQSFLAVGQGLTIVVGWPKGVVTINPVNLASTSSALLPWIQLNPQQRFLLMLGLPLLSLLWGLWWWMRHGRAPRRRGAIVPQYEPLAELTPAETGIIANGMMTHKSLVAELIELARLGYIKITHSKKVIKFAPDQDQYTFDRLKEVDGLTEGFRRSLFEALFANQSWVDKNLPKLSAVGPFRFMRRVVAMADAKMAAEFASGELSDTITLKQLGESYSWSLRLRTIMTQPVESLTQRGYWAKNLGWRIFILSLGVPLVGLVFVSSMVIFGGDELVSVSILFSLAVIIVALVTKSSLTPKGASAREYILGLKMYLQVAEKDRLEFHNAPQKNSETFEKLLPYAIALGIEEEWAAQFKDLQLTSPDWYSDQTRGSFNTAIFVSNLHGFTNSLASSSGTGGSSGFGGGGSSGGGGGGGGGGSW